MKLTVYILEDFINTLTLTGDVVSFSDDGTDTKLNVDATYHLRNKMVVSVDNVEYTVVSVVVDTSIIVSGVIVAPVKFSIAPPFYFHGTPMATNSQINGRDDINKVPMIYLYEVLREKNLSVNSAIVRESDLRLFFLDNANFSDWATDDHYSKRIVGLNSLVDQFIDFARKYKSFYLYETDFTRINHVKWGVFTNNKGHEKRILDDELTGVELSFTLPIKRNCNQ